MTARQRRLHRYARTAFWLFMAIVTVLLVRAAQSIQWHDVGSAIAGYRPTTLAAVAALASLSYLVYCSYDLAARRYAHHSLPTGHVLLIAGISYAFGLNIGALAGGTGIRFRLYSRAGLGLITISRVVAFSVATNWLGYLLLAGMVFASRRLSPPPGWELGTTGLRAAGFLMLGASLLYLVACQRLHGRIFHLRGHHFRLPSPRLGLLQFALATANWSLMAAIVYLLLPKNVDYSAVLGVFLLAAIATAVAHIPAGIGVIEAVFVALLGHAVPSTQLFAAILTYRVFHYLLPMLVALVLYPMVEARSPVPPECPPPT